jgi:nucleotide-binding universal stress UspA family protein
MRLQAATSRCVWCTPSIRPTTPTPDAQGAARAGHRGAACSLRVHRRRVEKPVKIKVAILQGHPTRALMDASRGRQCCVSGSIGLKHFTVGRVGSTADTLVARAHCPVAMIRRQGGATSSKPGWVVVEVDESVDSSALQVGVEEAQSRDAPLRVITARRSRLTDIHDVRAASEGNPQVWAHLGRSLACWRRRHPDLDLRAVAVGGQRRQLSGQTCCRHATDRGGMRRSERCG